MAGDAHEAARCLDKAIEHYQRGTMLDLNDYYPSSNLPRLLRLRDDEGDDERASTFAVLALTACERARQRSPSDPWVRPTLLGQAFDVGQLGEVRRLLKEVRREGAVAWRLDTTIEDLERSVRRRPDDDSFKAPAMAVIAELRGLMGPA